MTDKATVIRASNLSKTLYPSDIWNSTALGRAVSMLLRKPRRRIRAVDGVDLEIRKGEGLGIVGPNGAGKTTLLRLLAGVYPPTGGTIDVRGQIGSLIDLGAGFHPHLSGRENIYLNGVLLGLTRREISERFDEIVDFSGLTSFLDTPLRQYSAGMKARLGFAVAAFMGQDILLVDEVLAVGDAVFQAKSFKRMQELLQGGRTLLLVSHQPYYIVRYCQRAIWMEQGRIVRSGDPRDIVEEYTVDARRRTHYTMSHAASRTEGAETEKPAVRFETLEIQNLEGQAIERVRSGEPFQLEVKYFVEKPLEIDFLIHFISTSHTDVIFSLTSSPVGLPRPANEPLFRAEPGHRTIRWLVRPPAINPGELAVTAYIVTPDIGFLDQLTPAGYLEITASGPFTRTGAPLLNIPAEMTLS